jgi:segregation and condensation protein B
VTHQDLTTELNQPAGENTNTDADAELNGTQEGMPVEDPEAPVAADVVGAEALPQQEAQGSQAADEAGAETMAPGEFALEAEPSPDAERARLKAVIEAMIYITDEPLTLQQIANATGRPTEFVREILDALVEEYSRPDRGLTVRELAGGYKMSTKPEHHEEIRHFVKNLKPPLKLSLAALETLAVIAYKQPITAPEIMEIRGVQGAGVLKTLLDRKLIATAGRKNVVGKPILYKTTREFLIQFGLKDLSELPTLKEFEELGRLALTDETPPAEDETPQAQAPPEPPPPDEPPVQEPGPEPPPVEEPPPPPGAPKPPERAEPDASE